MKVKDQTPIVFVVDDDSNVLNAIRLLMESVGHRCEDYASGDEFIDNADLEQPGCLISDIRMPGTSGLQLQEVLRERNCALPIIFISGHGDIPMAVEAMRQGAIDFIQKPFRDQEILDRVDAALQLNQSEREQRATSDVVSERVNRLTNREREVFELVAKGLSNKVIAQDLALSQRTVEIHRARVMEKMEAATLPDLVRMHLATIQ